jgi:arylsulfatase
MRARHWLLSTLCLFTACAPPAPERAEHIVLISVDTLRADRLGAYGYERARTPNIDALAAQSIRFERAYAHSSMTLPSVASLITGLLPAEHGIYANFGHLPIRHTTLAEHAKAAGFSTGAFIGNYALRPNRRVGQGFDHYTRAFRDRELVRDQPENTATWLTDQAIAWLSERGADERLLLWVHYQEPHGPYTPRTFAEPAEGGPVLPRSESTSGRGAIPDYQWLGHGRLAEYQARYDGEIAEVDLQLGRLLRELRARGVLARSALAFTADHGEAFGEDGLYCAHGEGLSDALLRVPLLLRAPGVQPAVRSDRVRQIDVAPTLLALAGLDAKGFEGHSLLETSGDRPVVAQLVRPDRRWRSLRRDGFELLDDARGAPRLVVASAAARPAAARQRALLAELESLAPWPLLFQDIDLSPEEEETLKAMGYAN